MEAAGPIAQHGAGSWTLHHVEELWLAGSALGDTEIECLGESRSLEFLDICGTDVSDTGLQQLSGLTSLRGLLLNRTRVTTEGKAKLERAIPLCLINGQ